VEKGAGRGPKSGRPAKAQFEGKIPGAGVTQLAKKMGGAGGTEALGLGQLGNLPPEV